MMKPPLNSIAWLALICAACSQPALAEIRHLSPDSNWFEQLAGPSAEPGDEFVLAEGVYADRRRLVISQLGSLEKPIVIRAAERARVVLRRPDARQNSINLLGCQHLILRDLEITGGSSGIRIGAKDGRAAKHVTLENLHIHHIGGVAVTANFPGETYESLTFRHNHIHHTGGHGEAFYLGSNNAADGSTNGYLFNSLIEGNHLHDLRGGTVTQGDGIELKDGCFNNIIRDNVIHDTNYPGIIVYSADGKRPNIIERNVIWNSGDHGIQAAADAVIRNNLVYGTRGDGIYCRNHQSAVVGGLKIINNTVLSDSSIRIVAPERFSGKVVVANNAVGATMRIPNAPEISALSNIVGVTELYPGADSKCIGTANSQYLPVDDFNGSRRGNSKDVGAYKFERAGNPGWKIVAGFKRSD